MKNAPANQLWRFARKSGFGERRCGAKSPRMKIFSLPKSATQSPRQALSSDIGESQRRAQRIAHAMCE
jgi:hypothetical protein